MNVTLLVWRISLGVGCESTKMHRMDKGPRDTSVGPLDHSDKTVLPLDRLLDAVTTRHQIRPIRLPNKRILPSPPEEHTRAYAHQVVDGIRHMLLLSLDLLASYVSGMTCPPMARSGATATGAGPPHGNTKRPCQSRAG